MVDSSGAEEEMGTFQSILNVFSPQIYQSDRSLHMEAHVLAKKSYWESSYEPRAVLPHLQH